MKPNDNLFLFWERCITLRTTSESGGGRWHFSSFPFNKAFLLQKLTKPTSSAFRDKPTKMNFLTFPESIFQRLPKHPVLTVLSVFGSSTRKCSTLLLFYNRTFEYFWGSAITDRTLVQTKQKPETCNLRLPFVLKHCFHTKLQFSCFLTIFQA